MTKALDDVVAERLRQTEVEGWDKSHDDLHQDHQLSKAAACYACPEITVGKEYEVKYWPWDRNWWKPRSHRENCVRAAALLLAEIERLDRM